MTEVARSDDLVQWLHAEMENTNRLLSEREGLREILRGLASRAREVTGADFAAIALFDDEPLLHRFTQVGMDDETARRMGEPPVGKGLLGVLAESPGPVRIENLQDHPSFSGWPDGHPDMRAFLGVPVRASEVAGAFYLTRLPGRGLFSDRDELAVSTLALQAAVSLAYAASNERSGRIALLEERVRIAHDLHDGTIQSLYALGLELETSAQGLEAPAREELAVCVERINALIREIRDYISALGAPTPRSQPDLARDIPFVVQQLVPEGVDTIVNISAAAHRLRARDVEDLVYIAREAVSNAVRHGSPSKIAIDVRESASGVTLTVQDNGTGFDPATAREGMGSISMRSRAGHLSAELGVESIPGMGATVRLRVPAEARSRGSNA